MRDLPILFKGEMVREVQADTKTHTRRLTALEFVNEKPDLWRYDGLHDGDRTHAFRTHDDGGVYFPTCPYGAPGDRLWVRETFAWLNRHSGQTAVGRVGVRNSNVRTVYRADRDGEAPDRWRPSIHMPRWASRISLEVTEIRAERLQAISEADARAEGIAPINIDVAESGVTETPFGTVTSFGGGGASARIQFIALWDSINGERGNGWKRNPWVWVVVFRRLDA